jgi:hypothetical protein
MVRPGGVKMEVVMGMGEAEVWEVSLRRMRKLRAEWWIERREHSIREHVQQNRDCKWDTKST